MPSDSIKLCAFQGCGKKRHTRGFCAAHWQQCRKGQELRPLYLKSRQIGTPPRIAFDEQPCPRTDLEGPCHIFRGRKSSKGYGMVWFVDKDIGAHVYLWELKNGPTPENLEIDHQCHVRACCNVNHLRAVTHKVNMTENVAESICWKVHRAKTHCPYGHPYDDANTNRKPNGHRACRTCENERKRMRRRLKNMASNS